jgi:uncharacterized protein|tara:strand:- start:46 stop:558 length:513 start_codon:yes stop_codon:yes gene_type:complete
VLALDEIEEGVNRMSFEVDARALDLGTTDVEVAAPVSAQLTVSRTMQMYTIRGQVRTSLQGACCRCLSPAVADLETEIQFLLQRKEASDDEIEALEDQDDVDIVDPGTKEVDLVDRLHDAVVLELPLRLYCKTDCKGLCPQCGQDLNVDSCSCADDAIDPRWEALAQLKN